MNEKHLTCPAIPYCTCVRGKECDTLIYTNKELQNGTYTEDESTDRIRQCYNINSKLDKSWGRKIRSGTMETVPCYNCSFMTADCVCLLDGKEKDELQMLDTECELKKEYKANGSK